MKPSEMFCGKMTLWWNSYATSHDGSHIQQTMFNCKRYIWLITTWMLF